MKVNINGKTFDLMQAKVNNMTDVEIAKFCVDSDDPAVRELAYRLGAAHGWNNDGAENNHAHQAEV